MGSLIHALERIATTGLHLASHREPTIADLGTVLDEARIVIEPTLRESDIHVSWKIHENLPLVQADHHSLLQVFINLARNIDSVLHDASRREVLICAGMERDLVVVRFYDSGPGVAHPEELFKPFQPGTHSSGLGLYISRAILHAHGGDLRYEPQSSGACFAVELWPVDKVTENR
jgi:C4-dicarboxylate-specific signal transduction histidine kinase